MLQRPHVQKLIERVRPTMPLRTAFVYACDRESLQLAISGAFAGYLAPLLLGPAARIRDVASREGLSLSQPMLVDTGEAPEAAVERAIGLARAGEIDALVNGTLPDDALLRSVAAPESGLRTATRLSHAAVLDLPGYDRPLVVADARLNIAPTLAAKRDILLNALQLARSMGIAAPLVALLAATNGPSQSFASTTDAVALRSMGTQGLFGAATFMGPVTPEHALAPNRGADGAADVLLAPAMEAAIMLVRAVTAVTAGIATGIVLGARLPIVLPARGDTLESRMASCVLAALVNDPRGVPAPSPALAA